MAQILNSGLFDKLNFKKNEFLGFSIISFLAKSALLIRLPYRSVEINTFYTLFILLGFYLFFRFRYKLIPPFSIIACLAIAIAIDVLGNFFGLYGKEFGPVQYDEFSHTLGAGFAFPPTFWLLRETTRKFGHHLTLDMLAFFAVTITFSFCAYYEILELWDEKYYGGKRLWSAQDSANDLQWDLIGIITFAILTVIFVKIKERNQLALNSIA